MSAWCDRDSACALHGEDLGAAFDAVVAIAPVTRMLVPQLLAAGRDPEVGWPVLVADADGHQSLIVSRCALEVQRSFVSDPASVMPTTVCFE